MESREQTYDTIPGPEPRFSESKSLSKSEKVRIILDEPEGSSDSIRAIHELGDGGVERYEFRVLKDGINKCKIKGNNTTPLFISKCLADFGFYAVETRESIKPIHEHLLNIEGHIQKSALNGDSELKSYLLGISAQHIDSVIVSQISEYSTPAEVDNKLAQAEGVPEREREILDKRDILKTIYMFATSPAIPLICPPKIFQELGDILSEEEMVRHMSNVVTMYKIDDDTGDLGADVIMRDCVRHFECSGKRGEQYTINKDEGIAGMFGTELIQEELSADIYGNFYVSDSDSDVEKIIKAIRALHYERDRTDFSDSNDSDLFRAVICAIRGTFITLCAIDAVGEERIAEVVSSHLNKQLGNISLDNLPQPDEHGFTPTSGWDTILPVISSSVIKLTEEEREKIDVSIGDKFLVPHESTASTIDEYLNQNAEDVRYLMDEFDGTQVL